MLKGERVVEDISVGDTLWHALGGGHGVGAQGSHDGGGESLHIDGWKKEVLDYGWTSSQGLTKIDTEL